MNRNSKKVAVIGAGFFGLYAAHVLAERGHKVVVFERNSGAMLEASLLNQARVHGGYHYPRSLSTAARSRVSYERFVAEFNGAITESKVSAYPIANGSKISASKFRQFCKLIDAPISTAPESFKRNFAPHLIEDVFLVHEDFFSSTILREIMLEKSRQLDVKIQLNSLVESIVFEDNRTQANLRIQLKNETSDPFDKVIVATYGKFTANEEGLASEFVYEVCELVQMKLPPFFQNTAITVMDGPYWSLTPWPAFESSVLTHVRHTPHARFSNPKEADEYAFSGEIQSRSSLMIEDALRYLPALDGATVLRSRYVTKTILKSKDRDDGRPIVTSIRNNVCYLVGGKVDNVYDSYGFVLKYVEGD